MNMKEVRSQPQHSSPAQCRQRSARSNAPIITRQRKSKHSLLRKNWKAHPKKYVKLCTQHAAIQWIAKSKTYTAWCGACGSQQAEQPRPGSSSILSRALKTRQGSIRTFEKEHNFVRKMLKSCAQHAAMQKRSGLQSCVWPIVWPTKSIASL